MNNRILKLRDEITKQKVDALLISSIPNIIYLTGYNNFSSEEREAFLLITKKNQYIITDTRYSEAIKKDVPYFQLLELSSQSSFSDLLKKVITHETIKTCGFEAENITVGEYTRLKKIFTKLKPVPLSNLRIHKEKDEIEKIQKACALGDEAFKHVLKYIKKGITEKELAFQINQYIRQKGHDISFKTIVAFGKNAAIPHHNTSHEKLTNNQFVLMDFGAKVDNYCSDMTRTVFFGKADAEQKRMYQIVLESQKKAIEYLKSNIYHLSTKKMLASEVDQIARSYIIDNTYPPIPHSLGHGTGIEVHEAPNLSPKSPYTLSEGMVFSIEPGIYLPGNQGVRIEDLVTLAKSGVQVLTKSPRELIEL